MFFLRLHVGLGFADSEFLEFVGKNRLAMDAGLPLVAVASFCAFFDLLGDRLLLRTVPLNDPLVRAWVIQVDAFMHNWGALTAMCGLVVGFWQFALWPAAPLRRRLSVSASSVAFLSIFIYGLLAPGERINPGLVMIAMAAASMLISTMAMTAMRRDMPWPYNLALLNLVLVGMMALIELLAKEPVHALGPLSHPDVQKWLVMLGELLYVGFFVSLALVGLYAFARDKAAHIWRFGLAVAIMGALVFFVVRGMLAFRNDFPVLVYGALRLERLVQRPVVFLFVSFVITGSVSLLLSHFFLGPAYRLLFFVCLLWLCAGFAPAGFEGLWMLTLAVTVFIRLSLTQALRPQPVLAEERAG